MRCSLTGRAVPSCCAHRLTRNSSISRATSRTSSAAARAGDSAATSSSYASCSGVHPAHPLAVGAEALRQPLEPPADRRQVAGQVEQVRAPVAATKPAGSSAASCARMSATASAWAGGGVAGSAT